MEDNLNLELPRENPPSKPQNPQSFWGKLDCSMIQPQSRLSALSAVELENKRNGCYVVERHILIICLLDG